MGNNTKKTYIMFVTLFMFSYELISQKADTTFAKRVDSLIEVSRGYRSHREFQLALDVIDQAKQICLKGNAGNSESFADCLFNTGLVYYDDQKFNEAEAYFIQARVLNEKLFGKENYRYANCLKNISNIYFDLGEYAKSEVMNLEEKEILEKIGGKENSKYVSCISNLATLYSVMGAYEKSESLILEAIEISGRVFGKKSSEYIDACNNLGILYFDRARYEDAEPLFVEVMKLREEVYGNQDIRCSASMNNLGLLYETIGNYPMAESMYLRSRHLIEKKLGKDHSDYVMIIQNLANLYWHSGDFKQCESLNLEAKEILEKTMGKEHPDYALGLDNLGALYQTLGIYNKAEQLYLQAIKIREKALGKEHPSYAAGIYSLASLYRAQGNSVKAEKLYQDAINTMGIVFGKKHPNYALGLSNLASLYADLGQHEKAEQLLLEAITIQEKSLGVSHPDFASSLNSLAELYSVMKRLSESEKLYLRVLTIRGKILGKEHTDYAKTLKELADVYENENKLVESEMLLADYQKIIQKDLRKSVSFLSGQELQKYISSENEGNSILNYLHLRRSVHKAEGTLSTLAYNQSLFKKGFLQTAAYMLNTIANHDQDARLINNSLKSYRRLLAKEYSLPYAERDSNLLVELEQKADAAEKKLANQVKNYADAVREYSWTDVQKELKKISLEGDESAAAIEFMHYRAKDMDGLERVYYSALVVRPESLQPVLVDLCEESQLDRIMAARRGMKEKTNFLYASRGATPIDDPAMVSTGLYSLIWQPVFKELEGVQRIYFASTGRLNQLNMTAIQIDSLNVLSDKFRLVQLGSTRQLVQSNLFKMTNQEAVLFGGINYELDTMAMNTVANTEPEKHNFGTRGEIGFSHTISTLRGGQWNYLAGTEEEIYNLERLMKKNNINVKSFRNSDAKEEVFKSLYLEGIESPRVIHLATHGYFFPDQDHANNAKNGMTQDSVNQITNANVASPLSKPKFETSEAIFKISEDLMIRSGLILAGANYAWHTGKPFRDGMEDGILTAYEISQMNLSNTELVVLSACETGLGDIQGNEGVYGLQRAFKIAGVKYIIMSLWQVPDKQTSMLMTTFYKKWLEDKMSIPDAFYAAQKELREQGFDPYQWAGFVLVE